MKLSTILNKLSFLFSALFFLWLYEHFASEFDSPLIFPHLSQVYDSFLELVENQEFWPALTATFFRVFKTFCYAFFFGTVAGFLSGLFPLIKSFLDFPMVIVRSTPVIALIVISLFFLESADLPFFCGFLMAFPVMTSSVAKGVSCADKKLLEMAKVYDFSFLQKFRYIYLDSALPFISSGAISIFGMCWKVVAAGEILSVPEFAIGSMLQTNRMMLETPAVYALTFSLVAACFVTEELFKLFLKGVTALRPVLTLLGNPRSSAALQTESFDKALTVPAPDASIRITDFSMTRGRKKLYENFSLEVPAHTMLTLLGHTGCGKTTLLNCIAGLVPQKNWTGTIDCQKVSYIFQENRLLPHVTLLKNISIPLSTTMKTSQAYATAWHYLKLVGLDDRADTFPEQLSGGEQQKLSIARAFAFPASVILMDEAFNSLDIDTKNTLIQLLKKLLQDSPRTILNVTHAPGEADLFDSPTMKL